jgi:hypothetical protein
VLPRKEVIQPQLPLRLPCSRGSPCRHEARTISSSSLLDAKSRIEQTALSRVPRTHSRHEGIVAGRHNVEPPEIRIPESARVVKPSTTNALRFEHRSKLLDISVVLLHELQIEPGRRVARRPALRIEVAPRIRETLFAAREGWSLCQDVDRGLQDPKPSGSALSVAPRSSSQSCDQDSENLQPPQVGLPETDSPMTTADGCIVCCSMEICPSAKSAGLEELGV